MTPLDKVLTEIRRYQHALLSFSAREHNGAIELVIELQDRSLGLHTYYAPVHERDIHSQWLHVSHGADQQPVSDEQVRNARHAYYAMVSYLDDKVEYRNSKGESWSSSVEDILAHVLLHSAYHRGQIALQMRSSGIAPAYTDFIHAVRQGLVE